SSNNPLKYAVLTEREFGEYISASDVGLLLYQDEQRGCMSGVAPNYVWGFKPLIALQNSIIGRTVAQNELGLVVREETPKAVAQALKSALRLVRQGWKPTLAYDRYRGEIAPHNVVHRLSEILESQLRRDVLSVSRSGESIIVKQSEHPNGWPEGFAKYLSN